jgi:hypothetical protein
MVEHAPQFESSKDSPERHEKLHEGGEKVEVRHERAETNQEKHEAPLDLEKIRETVEKQEENTPQVAIETVREEEKPLAPPNAELQKVTVRNTLSKVRRQLPARDRAFSKVIHQETIDKLSDITGKTVARPVSFMFGGFFGLVGSSVVLYLSRHYGFKYNYITFIVFFIAGMVLGWIVELLYRLMHLRSSRN